MSTLILVVFYKTNMTESGTLQTLLKQVAECSDVSLLIWDNSPWSMWDENLGAQLGSKFGRVSYHHTPDNTPLSKLYNTAIRENDEQLIILLDQDSELSETYLSSAHTAADQHPSIFLFAPQVYANGDVMSPGCFNSYKGWQPDVLKAGVQPTARRTVVTSGLVIRRRLFSMHDIKFNEALWLYAIDTDFFLKFRDLEADFCILDEKIDHESALRENLSLEQRLFRFRNLRWSYLTMHSERSRTNFLPKLYMVYSSLKHAIKFRSVKFLTGWDSSS